MKSASNEATLKIDQINKEAKQLLNKLFNNNLFTFEKTNASLLSSTIGRLTNATVESSYDAKLSSLTANHLCFTFKPFYFKVLNNRDICLAYRHTDDKNIRILLFDSCFKKYPNKFCEFYNFAKFEIAELDNSLIIGLIQRVGGEYSSSFLYKYGYNFTKIKHEVISSIDSMDSYGNNLYLATRTIKEEQWYLTVNILDEDLVLLKSVQQSDLKHPFSNLLRTQNMKVAGKFYVFLVGAEIILMNRNNHKMSKRFHIAESKIMLNSSRNGILAYNSERKELVGFDFVGKSQSFKLNGIKNEVVLVGCSNDKFFFYDSLLNCLYF